jgi:hypothetical protein
VFDVGTGGNVVLGKLMVHDAADAVVHQRLLVKRRVDAHHDPAEVGCASSSG